MQQTTKPPRDNENQKGRSREKMEMGEVKREEVWDSQGNSFPFSSQSSREE
jgi:hypothetical protein